MEKSTDGKELGRLLTSFCHLQGAEEGVEATEGEHGFDETSKW